MSVAAADAVVENRFRPAHPIDLRRTFAFALRYPTGMLRPDGVWRATRTPDGPATLRLRSHAGEVTATGWGPGAAWAVERAPVMVGAGDDPGSFVAAHRHPVVDDLHRHAPGLRVPRTEAVFETLVHVVLEQKVQSRQARRAYRAIVQRHGEPAPGPAAHALGLRLLPHPDALARIPAYVFHRYNVERKRAVTLVTAARYAERLDECAGLPLRDAYERLRTLPGIGAWSAAEVAVVALGDHDAVSVGDYHLPNTICWALAGEARGDDRRMLELLEPWRGQRARVVRLVESAGITAPKYGPRLSLHDIRAI
ncbi:MAG TPA: hypothetical protein VF230_11470 [Acidimicrobiales bacterium]